MSQLSLTYLNGLRTLTLAYHWANHHTQSLFHNNVLSVSCNFLNTVLKGKTRMGVEWLSLCPTSHADWELRPLPSIMREFICKLLAREKTQLKNSKYVFY